MIPGEAPVSRASRKKPPRSVGALAAISIWHKTPAQSRSSQGLPFWVPSPLLSRVGKKWLRSIAADYALIALNWLLIGALLVPLRMLYPRVRIFAYAAGTPIWLLGNALLHAALITLVGYVERLQFDAEDLRLQRRILAKSVGLATLLLCAAYSLQGAPWTVCGLFCIAGSLHLTTLWMWRQRIEDLDSVGRRREDTRNVLVVGAGTVGKGVAAYLDRHPGTGRRVCGFLDDDRPLGDGILGRIADLPRIARKSFADEVILAAPQNPDTTAQVLGEARVLRLDVEIIPDLFGYSPVESETERVAGVPLICLHAERLPTLGLFLKRIVDVAGSVLLMLALWPLLAAIALLIKFDSEGPVLYSADRVGRKGRLFRCYKFRTMVHNADELKDALRGGNERAGPFFKISRDPRITRIGRFLRRYSLDELPQLWNVMKGEMSLVGPRPHPLDDFAEYEIEHLARLDVTPGITGLWQVTARRDPSFQRGMELDREYIRTWSLGLDLQILLKTFLAVMQGSGS